MVINFCTALVSTRAFCFIQIKKFYTKCCEECMICTLSSTHTKNKKLLMDFGVLVAVLPKERIEIIRVQLQTKFQLKEDVVHSQMAKALFVKWHRYLVLATENSREYDAIKGMVVQLFGKNVAEWLRDYTTFLTRNVIMRKRGYSEDKIVTNLVHLIL